MRPWSKLLEVAAWLWTALVLLAYVWTHGRMYTAAFAALRGLSP